MKKPFSLCLVFCLSIALPTWAAPLTTSEQQVEFDQGTRAYDAENYKEAYEIWLPLAREDDLAAQRNIAHLFHHGLGVEKDLDRAFYWYERAADAGLASAQANIGILYLTGEGTDKDAEKAAYYLYRAARAGHTVAQYNMALMFDRGVGVTADPIKALAFYYLAARNNHSAAQERLTELVTVAETPIDETDYVQQVEEDWAEDQKKTGFFVLDILSSIYKAAGAQSFDVEMPLDDEPEKIEAHTGQQN